MDIKKPLAMSSAILSMYFIFTAIKIITPALNSISTAFPEMHFTSIILVFTFPSLIMVPSIFLTGMIAGKKIKFKTLTVIGLLIIIIFGIAPAYTGNFTVILFERIIFGIGLGIINSMGSALILRLYKGEHQARMLGLGSTAMNIGGVVFQFLSGYLASIHWNYIFYLHGLAIIPLILVLLFLHEPEKEPLPENAVKIKVSVPSKVWLISISLAVATILFFPLEINISSFLKMQGLGNSTVAALVLVFFSIGGMIGGAAFSALYKCLKRYIVAFVLFIVTAGMAGVLYGGNIILIFICSLILGFGFYVLIPMAFMLIGMIASPEQTAISSSILWATMNLSIFLSTYWIGLIGKITGNAIIDPIFIGMTAIGLAAIAFLFIDPIPKPKID